MAKKRINGWNPQDYAAWQAIAQRLGITQPPTGSPAPDPTPVVPDAAYLGQVGANDLGYNTVLGRLPGQVGRAASDYGYNVTYKPGSSELNPLDPGFHTPDSPEYVAPSYEVGGVDPSNPNSRAALLQRSYENQLRGNTTSLAARGQLYAGSLQNAQNDATRTNQTENARLQGSFGDLLAGYFGNATNARVADLGGNAQAFGDLVGRQPAAASTVTYAGVPYTPANATQPFASPAAGFAPTPESVLASKSLLGTDITKRPPSSFYKSKRRR